MFLGITQINSEKNSRFQTAAITLALSVLNISAPAWAARSPASLNCKTALTRQTLDQNRFDNDKTQIQLRTNYSEVDRAKIHEERQSIEARLNTQKVDSSDYFVTALNIDRDRVPAFLPSGNSTHVLLKAKTVFEFTSKTNEKRFDHFIFHYELIEKNGKFGIFRHPDIVLQRNNPNNLSIQNAFIDKATQNLIFPIDYGFSAPLNVDSKILKNISRKKISEFNFAHRAQSAKKDTFRLVNISADGEWFTLYNSVKVKPEIEESAKKAFLPKNYSDTADMFPKNDRMGILLIADTAMDGELTIAAFGFSEIRHVLPQVHQRYHTGDEIIIASKADTTPIGVALQFTRRTTGELVEYKNVPRYWDELVALKTSPDQGGQYVTWIGMPTGVRKVTSKKNDGATVWTSSKEPIRLYTLNTFTGELNWKELVQTSSENALLPMVDREAIYRVLPPLSPMANNYTSNFGLIKFSADGSKLLTLAGTDVVIIETHSGNEIFRFKGALFRNNRTIVNFVETFHKLQFSPDGEAILYPSSTYTSPDTIAGILVYQDIHGARFEIRDPEAKFMAPATGNGHRVIARRYLETW